MADFQGQVSAWVAATKQRMLAVRNGSVQRVLEVAQSNVPVKTGFLRASLTGVIGEPNFQVTTPPKGSAAKEYDPTAASLVLVNAALGDVVSFAWTAAYARRINYGFVGTDSLGREYNQQGTKFRDLAVQQWPRIVQEESAKAQAAVEGRG